VEDKYRDNVSKWKSAYIDIRNVCSKYSADKNVYRNVFDDIDNLRISAENHLMLIDWYEKYGIKLDHEYKPYTFHYFKIGDITFSKFNDAQAEKDAGSGRYISWSDDGHQPMNEWLMSISFSTGAYIFGEDYEGQRQLFQDFFNELKTYKPDYSDTANHNLYWKLENAKPIFDEYADILKKYRDKNAAELKQREVTAMRKKLAELEDTK
jgi:hypothetical protein